MNRPDPETLAAILEYARRNGRYWKRSLYNDWMDARVPEGPLLRALRNSHGPDYVKALRVDKTTGILRNV